VKELEEIYAVYFNDIYRFLYRLCGEEHLAEDLTSETFFKVMQSLDSFKGESDVKTWLFQIAKNTYFSYARKHKIFIDIDEILLLQEKSEMIIYAIQQLPEPYKEVFYLRIFAELNFQQIGKFFGKTSNWACVTFHRARKKIIEEMREEY
jgi:RNA polymerase sigma-70 factor (ECF subfamily)